MIAHHPDDAFLMAYAAGTADEATSLIIATHLHYCIMCRMRSRETETIGGSLLEESHRRRWPQMLWKPRWPARSGQAL